MKESTCITKESAIDDTNTRWNSAKHDIKISQKTRLTRIVKTGSMSGELIRIHVAEPDFLSGLLSPQTHHKSNSFTTLTPPLPPLSQSFLPPQSTHIILRFTVPSFSPEFGWFVSILGPTFVSHFEVWFDAFSVHPPSLRRTESEREDQKTDTMKAWSKMGKNTYKIAI